MVIFGVYNRHATNQFPEASPFSMKTFFTFQTKKLHIVRKINFDNKDFLIGRTFLTSYVNSCRISAATPCV